MASLTVGEILRVVKKSGLKDDDLVRFHLTDRSSKIGTVTFEAHLNALETISFDGLDDKCFDFIIDIFPERLYK